MFHTTRRISAISGHLARMASTRAIVVQEFGGPDVLKVADKVLPPLQEGQVLVGIKAAGVNPSDTYVRLGPHGPYAGRPELLPSLPYTPGKDGAGVVEAVAPGTGSVKVGDRVYTTNSITGTYGTSAVCTTQTIWPLPDNVSFAQGACIGVPCATALYALHVRAGLRSGERVFIHGASGAVGLAAVQLAKILGASLVVGSAGTADGEAAVLKAGADVAVNHRQAGYVDVAKEASPGGFDVVLEMAAHANLPTDLSLVVRRGRVVIIGSRSEAVPVNPRHFMAGEVDVRGVFLPGATRAELEEMHQVLFSALASGKLVPVVSKEFALEDAASAHKEVMEPSKACF